MAIAKVAVTGADWTAITTAGQAGYCHISKDAIAGAECRIHHSKTGAPTAGSVAYGRPVFKPSSNTDVVSLAPDDSGDIFYARCRNAGQTVDLIVDVK